jgi:hypothetical protein
MARYGWQQVDWSKSDDDIASIIGCTKNTVSKWRKRLKQMLKDRASRALQR